MPNYEKVTLDRFKLNLKEGKYQNLTGARRAIGKTTTWSAKEKEQAQELANKHFGGSNTPAKAAVKTGPKKVAKKATATKAAAAPKAAKKAGPKKAERTVESKPQKAVSIRPQPESSTDHRVAAQEGLSFVQNARQELEKIKSRHPEVDISENEKKLLGILDASITHMSQATGKVSIPAATAVPRIELPKPEEVKEAEEAEERADAAPTVQSVSENGVSDADLTPQERAAKDLFMQNNPGLVANLPRPQ